MTQTDPNPTNIEHKQTYGIEELQVVGEQLLARVKELVHEGNVRRIIIKQEGNVLLEIPLVFGVAGVVLAPVWAAIGVLGALIAQCSIEVIRTDSPVENAKEKAGEFKEKVEAKADDVAYKVEEKVDEARDAMRRENETGYGYGGTSTSNPPIA